METQKTVSKGREFPPDFRTLQRMASSEPTAAKASSSEESMKIAVAISLLRSKILQSQPSSSPPPPPPPTDPSSGSDALRWKRKAKDRKREIARLREDLKEAEDASSRCDLFPQTAICKCYFFDNLGKLRFEESRDGSVSRFNDVLHRRFFTQVRMKQRRRNRDDSSRRLCFIELSSENELDQLRASVDFLVELCDGTASPMVDANFTNWSHQAVDFILESLRKILSVGENIELVEGIVSSLIVRLLRRICCPSNRDDSHHVAIDHRSQVQHLLRELGTEPFIGQRTLLSVCERISTTAENLLCMDPFDDAFPNVHQSLFIIIQLIEFLISDHLQAWSSIEGFDNALMEGWVTSFLHARKAMQLLESRHGLYVLYMDRVANELAKQVCRVSSFQKLNQQLLHDLFN